MKPGRWALIALALTQVALSRPDAAVRFTFAVVGDRTGGAVDEAFKQVIDDLEVIQPEIVFTVGDHIAGYSTDSLSIEREWDWVLGEFGRIGSRCFFTPGNHDIWDDLSRRIYRRRVGSPDTSFIYDGCLFVILDVATLYAAEGLSQERIAWLEGVLAEAGDRPKFVFYHKPFWCEDFSKDKPNLIHEILKRYGVNAVFSGHYHTYFETLVDGIRYYCVPSSGGSLPGWADPRSTFFGYLLVRVKPETLIVRVVELGLGKPETVSFDDMMAFNDLRRKIISMCEVEPVIGDHLDPTPVEITITNLTSSILRDTLAWETPGGWKIEPAKDYIEMPPDEIATLNVVASCSTRLFPVANLELHFTYKGTTVNLRKPIKLRRGVTARRAEGGIEIDGLLDSGEWDGAGIMRDLYSMSKDGATDESTHVRVLYDSKYLYFALECFEQPSAIVAQQNQRDGFPGEDDRVTILLEPQMGSGIYYEVGFNPLGTIFDRLVEICPFGTYVLHPEWDGSHLVAASTSQAGWVVETAVPFEDLGISPDQVDRLGLNLARWHSKRKVFESLQLPYHYDSDRLGVLCLE